MPQSSTVEGFTRSQILDRDIPQTAARYAPFADKLLRLAVQPSDSLSDALRPMWTVGCGNGRHSDNSDAMPMKTWNHAASPNVVVCSDTGRYGECT
jgi:hypothetical protein